MGAALLTAYAAAAPALPVVDAINGLPNPESITVYADDANPNLYYFLPTSFVFARDDKGKPRFGAQYWGLTGVDPDLTGAAFRLSVQPAFDDVTVRRIAAALKARNAKATYAFPALTGSSLDVLLNGTFLPDNQDTREADSTAAGKTTPVGGSVDSTQTFTIAVSRAGAGVFARAPAAADEVIAARYTYGFLGVTKRLHARITYAPRRLYDYFKTSAAGTPWRALSAESWSADWKKLTADGSITVKPLDGGAVDEDAYLLDVFTLLIGQKVDGQGMFVPVLKPAAIAGAPEAAAFGYGFAASDAWEALEPDARQSIDIDTKKLAEREVSSGLRLSGVCAQYPASFHDLTLIGNKCIDQSRLLETARSAKACLDAKLSDLYAKRRAGAIPPRAMELLLAKANDAACAGLADGAPLAGVSPTQFRESTDKCRDTRLQDVKKHYSSGEISYEQWERQVPLVFQVPCRNFLKPANAAQ